MHGMNYQHLYYFWAVAREGSIAAATKLLHLTQPTISTQLRQLEQELGEKLLQKSGRGLALTESGRVAFLYADEIFALGRELRDTLRDRPGGRPLRATVGIVDVVPKLVAYRILRAALDEKDVELVCREGDAGVLLDALAQHEVDLVLTDAPVSRAPLRATSHLVGESGTSFFASPALAAACGSDFPGSLSGAPLLLPAAGTQLGRALASWFDANGIEPRRAAEFDDLALLTVFGTAGRGIFPGPTAIERDIESSANVRVIGRVRELKQRYYLVAAERKIRNPIVATIIAAAKRELAKRS